MFAVCGSRFRRELDGGSASARSFDLLDDQCTRQDVRKVIAFQDRADQPVVDVHGPTHAVLRFELPYLLGQKVVAEYIADLPREVTPP
jgi:hypothetical protein